MNRSEARRRGSGHSQLSPKSLYRPQTDSPLYTHSVQTHPPPIAIASPNVTTPPHSAPPRTLVWRDHDPYNRRPSAGMMPYPPGPSHLSGPPLSHSNSGSSSHHPSQYPHPHPQSHSHSHGHSQYDQMQDQRYNSPSRAYHMDDGLTPNLWHPAPSLRFTGKLRRSDRNGRKLINSWPPIRPLCFLIESRKFLKLPHTTDSLIIKHVPSFFPSILSILHTTFLTPITYFVRSI